MGVADDLAVDVGLSWKSLVRTAARISVALATGTETSLTVPQETNLTADALAHEQVGRPENKRKN